MNESVRPYIFIVVFLVLALWQWRYPARALYGSLSRRWLNHGGLMLVNALVLRLLFPLWVVAAAHYSRESSLGLFANVVPTSPVLYALAFFATLLLYDVLVYWQHRVFHVVPFLWRFHRVHHFDTQMDLTTGVRFHPGEIILSTALKSLLALVLAPPLAAIVAFEILLNAGSLFTHTNVRLPKKLDSGLRLVMVTPAMHIIHHSSRRSETDSNFGTLLSVWDRLFRSYTRDAQGGEDNIQVGLREDRSPASTGSFFRQMAEPFRNRSTE